MSFNIPQKGDIPHCEPGLWHPWNSKDQTVELWIQRANEHNAKIMSIGKDLKGWDLLVFAFGNPNGGVIMCDAHLHGNEHYGHLALYFFAKWLVESGDPLAKRVLERNYVVFLPVASYRWGRTNWNIPTWMSTKDPGRDGEKCGVNLNRNFSPTWNPDLSTRDSDSYSGEEPDSERETKALIHCWLTLKPKVYLNIHQGAGPYASATMSTSQIIQDVKAAQETISQEIGESPWSIGRSSGGNGMAVGGSAKLGIPGILLEIGRGWDFTDKKWFEMSSGPTFKRLQILILSMARAAETEATPDNLQTRVEILEDRVDEILELTQNIRALL